MNDFSPRRRPFWRHEIGDRVTWGRLGRFGTVTQLVESTTGDGYLVSVLEEGTGKHWEMPESGVMKVASAHPDRSDDDLELPPPHKSSLESDVKVFLLGFLVTLMLICAVVVHGLGEIADAVRSLKPAPASAPQPPK